MSINYKDLFNTQDLTDIDTINASEVNVSSLLNVI